MGFRSVCRIPAPRGKCYIRNDLENLLFRIMEFPKMYYYQENILCIEDIFPGVYYFLGNSAWKEASNSKCFLNDNLDWENIAF